MDYSGISMDWQKFNPADNVIAIEKQDSSTGGNTMAEVTTTSGTQRRSQNQSHYQGTFTVPEDGIYSIFLDLGDMDNRQYVVCPTGNHVLT